MRILIIDDVHPLLTEGLRQRGHEVVYQPELSREDLCSIIGTFEGLIVRSKTRIDRPVLSNAEKLTFIGRAGAGLDIIDESVCKEMGIRYFNSGEANADAVGEQAVAMLLSLYTNLLRADREVRAGLWDREGNRGHELKGSTIGIIGYGNTGKAVARKLAGFEVKVLAYDKYLNHYGDDFATATGMEDIFSQADVVSFHVPLTDETRYLGNQTFFQTFAKPIILLNLSRGQVVRLEDLMEGLNQGRIRGAALDVLENEHISNLNEKEHAIFSALCTSERTVLTPHIGGWTVESYRKISEVLLQKINGLIGV